MSALQRYTVEVRNASLYLDAQTVDVCMPGASAVAVLRRDEHLLIMPVLQAGGGGLILKVRNARGDRVVHAADFLRDVFADESVTRTLSMWWDEDAAALVGRVPPDAA